MKKLKYIVLIAFMLFVTAAVPVYIAASQQDGQSGERSGEAKSVDILFTHDTHSHLDSFLTQEDGENIEVGGFARIKTLIDEKKAQNADTFILDAGDFSMGTLVQTIFMDEAAELRMLGALGCDVATFGNHEFDYRSVGLAQMLENAADTSDKKPALALCNVDWESMEKAGLTEEQQMLKNAFEIYGVSDYIIVEKGNVKIAVIGVFGEDSLKCAPTCVLKFSSAPEAVRRTIEKIRANESGVDMLVCVSHSGTDKDIKRSEDEILAKEVPELDLIVSGHTHTVINEPIVHGNTYIVSCGSYGRYLGAVSMSRKADGRWSMDRYELLPVTDEIAQEKEIQNKIDGFMDKVD
ncbi:MAG: metallophosphatase, partial [Alistipes sp.]|nr:metallophosphatase [Alistipes sp.]